MHFFMSCVHIHTYNMHTAAHLHAYRHAGYFKLGPSVFQHTIFIPQMGFDCPCGAFELSTRAVIPSGKRFEQKKQKIHRNPTPIPNGVHGFSIPTFLRASRTSQNGRLNVATAGFWDLEISNFDWLRHD